jgi:DNA transformation protein and related proteins
MFGAVGLYHDGRFFALISADTVYFKVNESNRRDYEARAVDRRRQLFCKPCRASSAIAMS